MSIDDQSIDAYISKELGGQETQAFEDELAEDGGSRQIVADQLQVDQALQSLLKESDAKRERDIVRSVTDHLSKDLSEDLDPADRRPEHSGPQATPIMVKTEQDEQSVWLLKIVINGQNSRSHRLTEQALTIGRGTSAGLTIADQGASREHIELRQYEGGVILADLESRNGTKVNGKPVFGEKRLRPGDVIQLGTTEITLNRQVEGEGFRLLGRTGPMAGEEWFLNDAAVTTIGRSNKADITVGDESLSRINTAFIQSEGQVFVEDVDSANGTKVNGDRIQTRTILRTGDLVEIGMGSLEFIHGQLDDRSGTSLPGYRIGNLIGSGSIGVVYEAIHNDTDRRVAIKFIDTAISAQSAERARLLNAFRTLRRQAIDHVVPLLDEGADGKAIFMVMAFAETGSLADLMADPELPPDPTVVAALALDAARGLAGAAKRNHYHGGLRPGDILIDENGVGMVGDIGLGSSRAPSTSDTGSSADGADDNPELANQYELGAILYQALTGVPVPSLTGRVPPVTDRNPKVSRQLAQTIKRMLEMLPERRYPGWDAVIADLERVVRSGAAGLSRESARRPATPPPLISEARPDSTAGIGSSSRIGSTSDVQQPSPSKPAPVSTKTRSEDVYVKAEPARRDTAGQSSRSSHRLNSRPRREGIPTSIILLLIGIMGAAAALLSMPLWRGDANKPNDKESSAQQPPAPKLPNARPATPEPEQNSNEAQAEPKQGARWSDESAKDKLEALRTEHQVELTHPEADKTQISSTADIAINEAATTTVDNTAPTPETVATQAPAKEQVTQDEASDTKEPVVAEQATTVKEPVTVAEVSKRPKREGPLNSAAREGVWEKGSLLLTDETRLQGEFLAGDPNYRFRKAGSEQEVPSDEIAAVEFDRPRDIGLKEADRLLDQGNYDAAVSAYEALDSELLEHPYVAARLAMATAKQEALQNSALTVAEAKAYGKHKELLNNLPAWMEATGATRLERSMIPVVEHAFAAVANKASDEDRQRWEQFGKSVKLRLSYDSKANAKLADAKARATDKPDRQAYKLFREAAEGFANFDDDAWLLYARCCLEADRPAEALRAFGSMSKEAQKSEAVAALKKEHDLLPPAIKPKLLCLSYIGTRGNEAVTEVGFNKSGIAYAKGKGFTVFINTKTGVPTLNGRAMGGLTNSKPPAFAPQAQHRNGQAMSTGETLSISTRSDDGWSTPLLHSSAGWTFWGWKREQARTEKLGDSARGHAMWLYPDERHIGVMLTRHGDDTVLTRHPADLLLKLSDGGYSIDHKQRGGLVLAKIDVERRLLVGYNQISGSPFRPVTDTWGRLYMPRHPDKHDEHNNDHFELGDEVRGGLMVFADDLRTRVFGSVIGGEEARQQYFGAIAIHGNLCILGGYTDAKSMRTVNAVQDDPAGGLDGCFALIKLW